VGWQRKVADVVALLGREGVRLVTHTGPGGLGENRLALRGRATRPARSPTASGSFPSAWPAFRPSIQPKPAAYFSASMTERVGEAGLRQQCRVVRFLIDH
jgi:hypothetical protein